MSQIRFVIGTAIVAMILVVAGGAVKNQQRDELEQRVKMLEQRVQKLESVLFATAKLSVFEAERQLEEARERWQNSRRLHVKGFITLAQLQQDRFNVQQATRELELARSDNNQQTIVGEIDLMDAKRELQIAEDSLNYTQRLFDRGYVSDAQLQAAGLEVRRFKKRLELAENKAKAASELLKMGGQEPSADQEPPKADEKPDQR